MSWQALSVPLGLLGSLGVFVFGLKTLSEALQKVGGSSLKAMLARRPRGPLQAVGTGLLSTSVVLSSSATSVMVVGFVAAGMLSLSEAIGMLMGANIGATLIGWLVAGLGFRMDIASFALPVAGVGFAMGFMRGARVRQWGEVLLGFGLLFLGLDFLMGTLPPAGSPEQLAWLGRLADPGARTLGVFVFIGAVVTVVLQSSAATLSFTLTLAALGWLPYPVAAAMVLGENVGTTATANLAAMGTGRDARRAARAHLLFNLVGLLWALPLFRVALLPAVDVLMPGDPDGPLDGPTVALHLALLHTLFNVANTALMLPLRAHLQRAVERLVPDDGESSEKTLRYLGTKTLIDTPELVLLTAERGMQHMVQVNARMLRDASTIVTSPDQDLGELVQQVLGREQFVDDLERQIIHHLTLTARAATSASAARKIAEMVQNTHRLERIGDHCAVLVRVAVRLRTSGHRLADEDLERLLELAALVQASMAHVERFLAGEAVQHQAEELERQIDELRSSLRHEQEERLRGGEKDLAVGLAYLDLLTHYEQIGDRAIGIIRHALYTASL